MTDDEWATFAMLLDKGFKWREQFGPAHEFTYRTLLDGYSGEQISGALRALTARGQKFGPTPGEIIAEIRSDPSRPTFDEMLTLTQTALRAWNRPLTGDYSNEAQMLAAREASVLERASEMHPLVGAFIARHGIRRLQDEIGELDGEYGAVRRNELEAAWSAHLEACEGRDVAALVTGRRDGLRALDPLSALGLRRPVAQIGSGTEPTTQGVQA